MSHTTKRKSAMKNLDALKAACERNPKAKYVGKGSSRYGNRCKDPHEVQLEGWNNRVTVDVATGECFYDNYNGRWGANETLDGLQQDYAVAAAAAQAAEEGHTMEEVKLDDGSIKLIIPLGGDYETADGGGGNVEGGWGT